MNYIGGMVAHENGKIYALATARLFEIQPGEGSADPKILNHVDLEPVVVVGGGVAILNSSPCLRGHTAYQLFHL